MDSVYVDRVLLCRVSPFGNLRIRAYLQLPAAYRSLSRPSSALSAKAFPLRSLQLDRRRDESIPFRFRRQGAKSFTALRRLSSSTKIRIFVVRGRAMPGFAIAKNVSCTFLQELRKSRFVL